MTRPRLLDLFCGAGGCSVGYHRAGFDVTGIDNEPHPDYPFELHVLDALDVLRDVDYLRTFDVVHASPPCPFYSTITPAESRKDHPDLIPPVRAALIRSGRPYIIENVEGARRAMINPVRVCGSAFGLPIRRHRLFESNLPLWAGHCHHTAQAVGVYGGHADPNTYLRPDGTSRGYRARSIEEAKQALGIDWMSAWDDLTDAIPPAYTHYLGAQIIDQLALERS